MNSRNGTPVEHLLGQPHDAAPRRRSRVFVIEDCPIVGRATANLLERETDLEVCGVTGGGPVAIEKLDALRPDLVVLGTALQGREGLVQLKEIKATFPRQPVLLFSIDDEALSAARAIREGAVGFVVKREPTAVLLAAVRRVLSGKTYISEHLQGSEHERKNGSWAGSGSDPAESLTERELAVFRLTGQGKRRGEIARLLGLSPKAVDHHRAQIKDKLCLKSANDMVRQALELEDHSSTTKLQPKPEPLIQH